MEITKTLDNNKHDLKNKKKIKIRRNKQY